MSIDIKQLNNLMSGVDFRACLNTNFQNLKTAIETLTGGTGANVIYTSELVTDTNYAENTIQICCFSDGVIIEQLVDGVWCLLCKYDSSVSNYMIFNVESAGIGYEIVNTDSTLEGKPVGYHNGNKVLAGITVDGVEDPIHAVGWYVKDKLLKVGRLKLDKAQVAGSPVYVCNETGGWTLETPVVSGYLVQVIGFVSDDGLYIEFDIQPWCIVA